MTIHCKIGTGPSTMLRLKSLRKYPSKGQIIKGIPLIDYNRYGASIKWKEYIVDKIGIIGGELFYYLFKY